MATSAGVEIAGVAELVNKLDALPSKIEKGVLRDGLQDMATKVAAMLSDHAPSDPSAHPGYYTVSTGASVHHVGKRGGKSTRMGDWHPLPFLKYSIEARPMNATKGSVRKKILANYYTGFLERGTKKMPSHAFVRPLIDGNTEELLQMFLDKLAKDIEEMASSGH